MKDLSEYSEAELKAEMKRRAVEAEAKAKWERLETCKLVLQNRDALISLLRHSRKSCEDKGNPYYHPAHGVADCALCCLRDLYERDDIEIHIDVRLMKVRS